MNDIKQDVITCNVSNTVSSLMSSVTAVARDFILKMFPDEYFREIYITTTQTSSEMTDTDTDEIKIKRYPLLSISPGYIADSNEAIMNPFPLWRRGQFQRFRFRNDHYGYKHIFYNDQDEIYIDAIPYRIKFSFEYKFKVESHMEKIDLTHILRQKFNQGERFFLNNQYFEAEIPNTIIKAIASIKNYDLKDPDEINEFYDYLQTFSNGNIHSKILHSTGNKMFSHIYMSNILVNVENPPSSDGRLRQRVNMSDAEGEVDMELSMELWIPGNYMFFCKKLPVGNYKPEMNENKIIVDKAVSFVPKLTRGNRNRLRWEKFVTEANVKVDKISFRELISKDILPFIDDRINQKDFNIINELFEIIVYRDGKEIKANTDYRINWKTMEIEMINPLFNYVYNIGIYVDQKLLYKFIGSKPIEH